MQWISAISDEPETSIALTQTCDSVSAALGGTPDVVFVFASTHHRAGYATLAESINQQLGRTHVFGCSAGGVIGSGRELEQTPALSLTAARLPGVSLHSWHLESDDLAPGSRHSKQCATLVQHNGTNAQQLLVIGDPFTFPTAQLLRSLDTGLQGSTIIGGLASGGQAPGEIALFRDQQSYRSGALVLALSGDVTMRGAVAQGCRPIGEPMFVTRCDGAKLCALDDRAPVAVINDLFESAQRRDRDLMQHSLFLGLAMPGKKQTYGPGDFLIRNVAGADSDKQSIWVGAELTPNQIVQFHVRDAASSATDLEQSLKNLRIALGGDTPRGALLFSCAGRGRGLYGRANHDSEAFREHFGDIALGGFFCNGEIGAVGDTTFVHAYTSAFATFTPESVTTDKPCRSD